MSNDEYLKKELKESKQREEIAYKVIQDYKFKIYRLQKEIEELKKQQQI